MTRLAALLLVAIAAPPAYGQVFTPARRPIAAVQLREDRQRALEIDHALAELHRAALEDERGLAEAIATSTLAAHETTPEHRARVAASSTVASLVAARTAALAAPQRSNAFLLTEAALTSGTTEPELSLQVANLFLGNDWARVYLRSTVPLEAEERDEQPENAGDTETSEDDATQAVKDRIRSALLDPYGGLLYIAGGGYVPVGKAVLEPGKKPRGFFVDVRGGVRAVQLTEAAQDENTSIGAFATGSIGLQFQSPVWDAPGEEIDDDAVGDFVAGLALVVNRVMDDATRGLFSGDEHPLEKETTTVQLHVGVSLKGLGRIVLTGNPWASSKALGKRWTIGLTVLND
ncbi:MAG: hypothetical protein ACRD26_18600 [Vicinamibacterales bacterium]